MFYDRKNIVPDHEMYVSFNLRSVQLSVKPSEIYNNAEIGGKFYGDMSMTFENTGRRPISIDYIEFDLVISEEPSTAEKLHFYSDGFSPEFGKVIKSQNISTMHVKFFSESILQFAWPDRGKVLLLAKEVCKSKPEIDRNTRRKFLFCKAAGIHH